VGWYIGGDMLDDDHYGVALITEAARRHPGTAPLRLGSNSTHGAIHIGNTELKLRV
jgi:hypothetical protein